MLRPFALLLAGVLLLTTVFSGPCLAASERKLDDPAVLEAVIDVLRDKGVFTGDEAVEMKKRLHQDRDAREEETLKTIQSETRKVAQEEVSASIPSWARRITLSGDFRLRYQQDGYDEIRSISGAEANKSPDRQRFRYRARLGLKAALNDWSLLGFRLATGNDGDPISTNDTLGDYFNKDNILFDRAYLKLTPMKGLTVLAGRHPNPFFCSDLVWDSDLNFEGLAVSHKQKWLGSLESFVTAGAFPLQEVNDYFSNKDKWLYGIQTGVRYKPVPKLTARLGLAYYYFDNIKGVENSTYYDEATDYSVPLYIQKGNNLFYVDPDNSDSTEAGLVSDFHELDVMLTVDASFWDPIHVIFLADYVKNLAFDGSDANGLNLYYNSDLRTKDYGYQVGLSVGYPKVRELWAWRGYAFYKYLGADAVVDAFTDSDFHMGGTDAKGWIFGGELGVYTNIWLSAKWITSEEIEGTWYEDESTSARVDKVDTIQIDLNAKF